PQVQIRGRVLDCQRDGVDCHDLLRGGRTGGNCRSERVQRWERMPATLAGVSLVFGGEVGETAGPA
ncbi:MAG: hypothetical protein ACKPJJ_33785, partial [Planctomycetaceae bacterium]